MAESRTEQPTPRRVRRARAAGQVARSGLLTSAVVLLVGALALGLSGPQLVATLLTLTAETFASAGSGDPSSPADTLAMGLVVGLRSLAPLLVTVFAAAVLASLAQVGPLFAAGAVRPDMKRLSPSIFASMFLLQ